jgi:hypothetical protein
MSLVAGYLQNDMIYPERLSQSAGMDRAGKAKVDCTCF